MGQIQIGHGRTDCGPSNRGPKGACKWPDGTQLTHRQSPIIIQPGDGNIRLGGQQGRPPDLSNPGVGRPSPDVEQQPTRSMVRGRVDAVVDAAGANLFQVEAMVLRRTPRTSDHTCPET